MRPFKASYNEFKRKKRFIKRFFLVLVTMNTKLYESSELNLNTKTIIHLHFDILRFRNEVLAVFCLAPFFCRQNYVEAFKSPCPSGTIPWFQLKSKQFMPNDSITVLFPPSWEKQ